MKTKVRKIKFKVESIVVELVVTHANVKIIAKDLNNKSIRHEILNEQLITKP
jgi:hypothetical protein